ncbi:hypothetical protein PG994_000017 [Apiospora phragmitis]|uniref:Starter acyltransferase (SAT) domain-containing protein n=1 Tax=Apiospora phragmitis TaxID=2905665 RepID=A0ABR1X583_9PEZI
MATHKHSIPSLLVFGPQARPSPDDLAELRHELTVNPRLSKAHAAALDLPKFWRDLVVLDSSLDQLPAESQLHEFVEWLKGERENPYCALRCPITLTFLLNFLIQMKQYLYFLRSVDIEERDDAQTFMLEILKRGGVHGFCVGFLCAITVSLSRSEDDIANHAVHGLRLALAIGVYVDKDAANEATTCISARWRHKQVNALDKALAVLKAYPDAYIAGITDETSMTITIPDAPLAGLLTVDSIALSILPRLERLVQFFANTPDLQFPGPDNLQIRIRSATDGKAIYRGDLVRYALENSLLKPVNWYQTLTLAMADVPQKQKCIALAGLSNHFPLSLMKNPDIQLQLLQEVGENGTEFCDKVSSTTAPELTSDSTNEGNGTEGSWVFASDEDESVDESATDALPSGFPPPTL